MSTKSWDIDGTWTLFLDRDGVINHRDMDGYITSIDSFKFLPNTEQAITSLSQIFHLIIVVTNQQGVGKGLMTERNLFEIHTYMCDNVHSHGGKIDKVYFAPNLRGAEDDMRKPNPAMAELAKMEFPEIDFERCIMVGDTDADILFGRNLGMKTVCVASDENVVESADLTVNNLSDFVEKIKENEI